MSQQADLESQYGRYAEAAGTIDTLQAFLAGQRAAAPDDLPLGLQALGLYRTQRILATRRDDAAGAAVAAAAAAREAERLAAAHPGVPELLEPAVWEHAEAAAVAEQAGDARATVAARRRAVAAAERWRAAAPANPDAANAAATLFDLLGTALVAAGDLPGAAAACDRAEAAYADPLLTAAGEVRRTKGDLGDVRVNRGWVALKAGDPTTADAKFADAEAVRRELAAAFPGDPLRSYAVDARSHRFRLV